MKPNKIIIIKGICIALAVVISLTFVVNAIIHKYERETKGNVTTVEKVTIDDNAAEATLEENPALWDYFHSCLGWHSVDKMNNLKEAVLNEGCDGYFVLLMCKETKNVYGCYYAYTDEYELPILGTSVNKLTINSADEEYLFGQWMEEMNPDVEEEYEGDKYSIYVLDGVRREASKVNEFDIEGRNIAGIVSTDMNYEINDNDFIRTYVNNFGYPNSWVDKRWNKPTSYETPLTGEQDITYLYDDYNINLGQVIYVPVDNNLDVSEVNYSNGEFGNGETMLRLKLNLDGSFVNTYTDIPIDKDLIENMEAFYGITFEEALEYTDKLYMKQFGITRIN